MRKANKILSFLFCFLLIFEQSGFAQVAGSLDISGYLSGLRNSFIQDKFRPLHLRFLSYEVQANKFNLLLDKGDLKNVKKQELQDTTKNLLSYFFIGITLPNDAFWVNLRPDAENNIIDNELAQTDVGRVLLEADLQLKKDTAKFTSPETPEGKVYWDKLFQKAGEIFGSSNITIPTLTRPWIVPDEIIIRETQSNAYIYKATLKVMLEQDYLKDSSVYNFKDDRLKQLNEYSSQLIREEILPKLTKEINTSKRYSSLRQVYYSLILAQWFKARFYGKGGLYSWLINRRDLTGLESKASWSKTTYFKAYQKSFKDGEYNIQQPVYTPYGQTIRSYFSGGFVCNVPIPTSLPQPGVPSQKTDGPTTVTAISGDTKHTPLSGQDRVIGVKADGGSVGNPTVANIEIVEEAPSPSRLPAEGPAMPGASSSITSNKVKTLSQKGRVYGYFNPATDEIVIDIEEVKNAFKDIAPSLSESDRHKVTGFVHAHEIFHQLVAKAGVKLSEEEEERLANVFAKKAIGIALTTEEEQLLLRFSRIVTDEGIRAQLSFSYESPDFLLNLHRLGIDIYNIRLDTELGKKIPQGAKAMTEGEDKIVTLRQDFFAVLGLKALGFMLQLAIHDLEEQDIFERYDSDYDAVVVKDDIMPLIASVVGMENGMAFNFKGTVVVTATTLQKAKEGDKESLFAIKHEHRHNDYRSQHGNNQKLTSEQSLIDELYAYFSAFVDVYGQEALSETRNTQIGNGTWAQIVASTLIKDYINGFYKAEFGDQTREILRVKLIVATFTIDAFVKKYGSLIALEYLKSAVDLDSILAVLGQDRLTELVKYYRTENTPEITVRDYESRHRAFLEFKEKHSVVPKDIGGSSPITEGNIAESATESAAKLSERFAGQRSLIEISNGTYATIFILDAIASIFPQGFFSRLKGLKIGAFLHTISNDEGGQFDGKESLLAVRSEFAQANNPRAFLAVFFHEVGHYILSKFYGYDPEADPAVSANERVQRLIKAYETILQNDAFFEGEAYLPAPQDSIIKNPRIQRQKDNVHEFFAEMTKQYLIDGRALQRHIDQQNPEVKEAYEVAISLIREALGEKSEYALHEVISETLDRNAAKIQQIYNLSRLTEEFRKRLEFVLGGTEHYEKEANKPQDEWPVWNSGGQRNAKIQFSSYRFMFERESGFSYEEFKTRFGDLEHLFSYYREQAQVTDEKPASAPATGGALKSVGIDGEDEVSKVDTLALSDWERKAEAEEVETREIKGLTIKAKFIYVDPIGYYRMPEGLFAYHFYDKQGNLVIVTHGSLEDSIAEEAVYHEAREAYWITFLSSELCGRVLTQEQKAEIARKAHILAAAEESVAFGVNRLTPYHQQQLACMSSEKLSRLRDEVREEQTALVRQYLSQEATDKYESYANKFRQKIEEKLAAPDYRIIVQELKGFADTLVGEFGVILEDFYLNEDTMGNEHNLRLVRSDYPKIKEYLQRLITNLRNAHPVWRLIASESHIEIQKRFAQEKVCGRAALDERRMFFPLDSEVLYDDTSTEGRVLLQAKLMVPEGVDYPAEVWVQFHEIAHLGDPNHRKPVAGLFDREGIRRFHSSVYQDLVRENEQLRERLAQRGLLKNKNEAFPIYRLFGPNTDFKDLQDILNNIYENKFLHAIESRGSTEVTTGDMKVSTVTPYAGTSQHELWAESLTAYFLCPNVLKQKDPIMFSLMQNVIRNAPSTVDLLETPAPLKVKPSVLEELRRRVDDQISPGDVNTIINSLQQGPIRFSEGTLFELSSNGETIIREDMGKRTPLSIYDFIDWVDHFAKADELLIILGRGAYKSNAAGLVEGPVAVDKKGGIDFRALPIVNQQINMGMLKLNAADLNRLNNINLGSEWAEIQNMVNAGIIPSNERIKEYMLASCLRQNLGNQMNKVLGCIADIMRMEEDRIVDADVELKDILVLIEAGKPETELQCGLSQIKISPQEPQLITP